MKRKSIRIGFIGAGSIGSLFGGYLANIKSDVYKIEVFFFGSKAHIVEIRRNGLKLCIEQQIREIKNIEVYENEEAIVEKIEQDPYFRFDFIFLTTKAYDSESAMVQYKALIDVSKWLVILQNGIGNEEIIEPYCEKSKIIRVLTTNGAFLDKPGQVTHTGKGITNIGFPYLNDLSLNSQYKEQANLELLLLRDLLNIASLKTEIVGDIVAKSWEKVLVNIGINALGALTRLSNGKLIESEELTSIMDGCINEAIKVAQSEKIGIENKDYSKIAYDVARKTAINKNSMLQDILNGRPTEIEFMNGRILKLAKKSGIKVPYNTILTYLMRGLEYSAN